MIMDFEFYETPDPLTEWLFNEHHIVGPCYEPCVGAGAILRASALGRFAPLRAWRTNDLDRQWSAADSHHDATRSEAWGTSPDWTVTNTAFSCWHEIAEQAIAHSRIGVAMYLRLSAHEPAKGVKQGVAGYRGWWQRFPPTGIYVCPRFAHQRSKKSGEWSTDSVTCAWTVWDKRQAGQFIKHAPSAVLDALDAYTQTHRDRVDAMSAREMA